VISLSQNYFTRVGLYFAALVGLVQPPAGLENFPPKFQFNFGKKISMGRAKKYPGQRGESYPYLPQVGLGQGPSLTAEAILHQVIIFIIYLHNNKKNGFKILIVS